MIRASAVGGWDGRLLTPLSMIRASAVGGWNSLAKFHRDLTF